MITLATLHEATAQQVFDQVVAHLKKQGRQSTLAGIGQCAYRGEGGLKCAAGCLIADSEYDFDMDNADHDTNWMWMVSQGYASQYHATLISDLQGIHDSEGSASGVAEWVDPLMRVAADNELYFDCDAFVEGAVK